MSFQVKLPSTSIYTSPLPPLHYFIPPPDPLNRAAYSSTSPIMSELTLTELVPLIFLFFVIAVLVVTLNRARHAPGTPPVVDDTFRPEEEYSQRETPAMRARRRGAARPARARRAVDVAPVAQPDDSSDSDEPGPSAPRVRTKKKKQANREAKREAQEARIARLEEIREREAKLDEERQIQKDRERAEADQITAQEMKIVQDRERRETKEYQSWKSYITVVESGEAAPLSKDDPELMRRMCEYVRKEKVIDLQEMAAEFSMRTHEVIAMVTKLEQRGEITGFFADHSKYMFLSNGEMQELAQYIEERGRVDVQQLAVLIVLISFS